jgi:DNA-binding protein YbaB
MEFGDITKLLKLERDLSSKYQSVKDKTTLVKIVFSDGKNNLGEVDLNKDTVDKLMNLDLISFIKGAIK